MRSFAISALSLVVLAVPLAGCGGDDDGATASAGDATLTVDDGVVVDSSGAAVYSADEEADGEIRCVDECEAIWRPVAVAGQDEPSADGVGGDIGTVSRPGGGEQVTLDGVPLYTFTEEGPGEVTGDGFSDAFGSRQFTWHVLRPEGAEGSAEPESTSGGGYGGY